MLIFFFLPSLSAHFSKAGKAKRIKKRSVCSRPVKDVFITEQNNQLYNTALHMWYIYSRSLNSTLCSWVVKSNYLVITFTDAALQFP